MGRSPPPTGPGPEGGEGDHAGLGGRLVVDAGPQREEPVERSSAELVQGEGDRRMGVGQDGRPRLGVGASAATVGRAEGPYRGR